MREPKLVVFNRPLAEHEYTRPHHYPELVGVAQGVSPASLEPDAALALFRANGPCAFMNAYDPRTVFSSIDHGGRYAYANQPGIAQWNLTRLTEGMLPLFDADQARAVEQATAEVHRFAELFEAYWLEGTRAKLGPLHRRTRRPRARRRPARLDAPAVRRLHEHLQGSVEGDRPGLAPAPAGAPLPPAAIAAGSRRSVRRSNPAFIPRNHKVEEALYAAMGHNFFP